MGLSDSLLGSHLIYTRFSWGTGGSRTEELAPCLVFQVYQRVETQFLASPTWKMWQSSSSVNSSREKKIHKLASEILCCDTSSFYPWLNYSVEGWQKRDLETGTVFIWRGLVGKLGWFTVPRICVRNYFSLNARGRFGRVCLSGCWCGHTRWQKAVSAEGHVVLRDAACESVWGQTACWEEQELLRPVHSVCYLVMVAESHFL